MVESLRYMYKCALNSEIHSFETQTLSRYNFVQVRPAVSQCINEASILYTKSMSHIQSKHICFHVYVHVPSILIRFLPTLILR
jgi:hypothetical protein